MFNNQPELEDVIKNTLPLQPQTFPAIIFDDIQENNAGGESTTTQLSVPHTLYIRGQQE